MLLKDKRKKQEPMPPWLKWGLIFFLLFGFAALKDDPEVRNMQWHLPKISDYDAVFGPSEATKPLTDEDVNALIESLPDTGTAETREKTIPSLETKEETQEELSPPDNIPEEAEEAPAPAKPEWAIGVPPELMKPEAAPPSAP